MSDRSRNEDFGREVHRAAERRRRARSGDHSPLWVGLGSFGVVGWSVAVSAIAGLAVGLWLDRALQDRVTWTVTGLLVGVAVGSLAAWLWVSKTGVGGRR